ncbi:MAG: response regulator transcription factor [candidate division WOR-3 bacterium]
MIKIIIVDDHALFRLGLIALLKKSPEFEVVAEYGSFDAVRPLIHNINAHLVLVDISLGKESGLQAIAFIKQVNPKIKVIILSGHKEEFYILNAIESGADGYIHKNAEPDEFINGIRKVMNNEKFFSSEVSSVLINSIYTKPSKTLPCLTKKEKQIIHYLVEGYSSKEIASSFNVSPRTIETHRANVLKKFGLRNTTELIRKIIENQIKL